MFVSIDRYFFMSISTKSISKDQLQLIIPSKKSQMVNIRVINILGESRISMWEQIRHGYNEVNINMSELSKGNYRILVKYMEGAQAEEKVFIYK